MWSEQMMMNKINAARGAEFIGRSLQIKKKSNEIKVSSNLLMFKCTFLLLKVGTLVNSSNLI